MRYVVHNITHTSQHGMLLHAMLACVCDVAHHVPHYCGLCNKALRKKSRNFKIGKRIGKKKKNLWTIWQKELFFYDYLTVCRRKTSFPQPPSRNSKNIHEFCWFFTLFYHSTFFSLFWEWFANSSLWFSARILVLIDC